MSLFGTVQVLEHSETNSRATCCAADYYPTFYPWAQADELMAALMKAPLEVEKPLVAGQYRETGRGSCAYGKRVGSVYEYVGIKRMALPIPGLLKTLWEKVEHKTGSTFNFCLCLLYPSGTQGLGWHADDERDLVPGSTIASVSLGAERAFHIRPMGETKMSHKVTLAHGSLLTMTGKMQRHFQHSVPEMARVSSPRINLTFRNVK